MSLVFLLYLNLKTKLLWIQNVSSSPPRLCGILMISKNILYESNISKWHDQIGLYHGDDLFTKSPAYSFPNH